MHDDWVIRNLSDRIKAVKRRALTRSIGTVADDSPFTVEIAGEELVGLTKLDSYTPTIGDRVYVVRSGRDLTVLGKVG